MSWLSEFLHSPLDYIADQPLKALGLLAAPIGLAAAPFLAPEIGAAAGSLFGGAEAATAGEAGALSFAGADAAYGATPAVGEAMGFSPAEGIIGQQAALDAADPAVNSWVSSLNAGGTGMPSGDLSGIDALTGPGTDGSTTFADRFSAAYGTGQTPDLAASPGLDAGGSYTGDFSEGIVGSQGGGDSAASLGGQPGMPDTSWNAGTGAAPDKSFMGGLWDSTKAYATAHPFQTAGAGIAGLGLVNNLIQGQRTSPNMAAMQGNAGAMNAQSQVMMKYLTSGTLPPGLDQAIKLSTQSAEANAVANAARNGMPTNPTQNTALAQQLSSIRNNAVADVAKMGVQLMSQGLSMAQISNQLYLQLEQLNRQQARDTGVAIANFAAALNGGGSMKRAA